jgi:hypothetical protein
MIATPDATTASAPRLFVGKRFPRPDLRLVLAGMAWLGLFALLALTTISLWQRGVMSSELLFWESRRRLILDLWPPDLTTLVSTDPALVLFFLLPVGPVVGGVALLGTIAIIVISGVRRTAGLGAFWLPLLVMQPGVAISLSQYPSVIVRALLLTLVLACLLAYVRGPRIALILSAALGLGALTLMDRASWPLWIYLGVVLWFSRPMPTNERASLMLVTFFPAVFLLLAWQYLAWSMNVTRTGLDEAPALLFAAMPGPELVRSWHVSGTGLSGLAAGARQLCVYGWPYLLAVLLVLGTSRTRMSGWFGAGVLLLLAPAIDLLARAVLGYAQPDPPGAVLPTFAVLVAAGVLGGRARFVVGCALLVGAIVGWGLVLRADSNEPARIARQAVGLTAADPLLAFRGLVSALDERSQPGDVVLVDDPTLYPLVALVEEPATLLLPYRPEYALASQQPGRVADLIVTTDATALIRRVAPPGTSPTALPGYRLVTQAGRVALYERTLR